MTTDFSEIKEKLNKLKKIDRNLSIFGASRHNYKSCPATILEIEQFEMKFEFRLPEKFRSFLLEVGAGAGPYYGIWNLKEIESELSIIKDFKEEENILVSPASEFPLKKEQLKLMGESVSRELIYEDWESTYPIDGSITIIHQGCLGFSTLITTGDYKGTVWDLYWGGGYNGSWRPAKPAVCLQASNSQSFIRKKYELKHFPERTLDKFAPKLINFLDWYENWLDDSLLAFDEFRKFNSSRIFNKFKLG